VKAPPPQVLAEMYAGGESLGIDRLAPSRVVVVEEAQLPLPAQMT
jgi:hypothetical protein